MTVVTEWFVTALLHYRHICCYIIGCYVIGKFRSNIIGAYSVTLSGDFVTLSVLVITLMVNLELHYRLMLHYRALLHYRA